MKKPKKRKERRTTLSPAGVRSIVIEAPAKVNLTLQVLGRRSDGYHALTSTFATIGLYDTLTAYPREDDQFRLTISGSEASDDISTDDNLVLTAANAVLEFAGASGQPVSSPYGVDFELVKRIPPQAGLGGGSSDAVAAMAAVCRLWGLTLSTDQEHEIAATLGSDLNFFVENCPLAICRGRGEQVEPLDLGQPFAIVVAKPPFGASTGDVFAKLELSEEQPPELVPADEELDLIFRGYEPGHNDLLPALLETCPKFADWLETLDEFAEGWSLTGSGTAVYHFAANMTLARRVAHELSMRNDGTFAFAAAPGRRTIAVS